VILLRQLIVRRVCNFHVRAKSDWIHGENPSEPNRRWLTKVQIGGVLFTWNHLPNGWTVNRNFSVEFHDEEKAT
jgi:hypothetical protein